MVQNRAGEKVSKAYDFDSKTMCVYIYIYTDALDQVLSLKVIMYVNVLPSVASEGENDTYAPSPHWHQMACGSSITSLA